MVKRIISKDAVLEFISDFVFLSSISSSLVGGLSSPFGVLEVLHGLVMMLLFLLVALFFLWEDLPK